MGSLVSSFVEMGNPFMGDSSDVVSIDSKCIMAAKVVECIYTAELVGGGKMTLKFKEDRKRAQNSFVTQSNDTS